MEKRVLALDAMGVIFINEDDVEELLIPFLKKRFNDLDVEKLKDDEISRIAGIMSDHITSKIRMRQIEKNVVNENIPKFLNDFTSLTSSQRFGWFTTINFSYGPDEKITIYGFHSLNTPYSKYAVKVLSLILFKMYEYESDQDKENVTDNSFILELKPKTR